MPTAAAPEPAAQEDGDVRSLDRAFATLGLDPTADGNMVEIAYWCQVELLHAPGIEEPERRQRLAALNDARSRLAGIHTNGVAPPTTAPVIPIPAPRIERWAVVATLLGGVILLGVVALAIWLIGFDHATAVTVFVGVACAVMVAGWAFLAQAPRTAPPLAIPPKEAYRQLRVRPGAPAPLVILCRQYLQRGAIARDDAATLRVLELAAEVVRGTERPPAPVAQTATAPVAAFSEDAPAYDGRLTLSRDDFASSASTEDSAAPYSDGTNVKYLSTDPVMPAPEAATDSVSSDLSETGPSIGPTQPDRPASSTTVGMARRERTPPIDLRRDGLRSAGEFIVRHGNHVRLFELNDGVIYTVGSGERCEIRLGSSPDTAGVAEEHARITIRRGRVLFHHVAEDTISSINGAPATWAVLEPDDELVIGEFTCRYLAPEDSDVPASGVTEAGDRTTDDRSGQAS